MKQLDECLINGTLSRQVTVNAKINAQWLEAFKRVSDVPLLSA